MEVMSLYINGVVSFSRHKNLLRLPGLTCYIRQHNEHKLMSVSRAVLPASLNFVFRKLCTGIFFLKLIQNINNVSKYVQIYGGVVGPDK